MMMALGLFVFHCVQRHIKNFNVSPIGDTQVIAGLALLRRISSRVKVKIPLP